MRKNRPACVDCGLICSDGVGVILDRVLCRRCYRRSLRRALQSGIIVTAWKRDIRATLNRALLQIGERR